MSDTPTSPASPKRASTILGRLADAVREQNWFAVVLEVCIVVVGVVIGFQVTSWGQERQDRIREREYLTQLLADLEQAEETVAFSLGWTERRLEQSKIVQAAIEGTVADTVGARDLTLALYQSAMFLDFPIPRDTWSDLVSTGRLELISNRDLRRNLSAFYREADQTRTFMAGYQEGSVPYRKEVAELLSNRLLRAVVENQIAQHPVPDSLIPGREPLLQSIRAQPNLRVTSSGVPISNWGATLAYGKVLEQAQGLSEQLRSELNP